MERATNTAMAFLHCSPSLKCLGMRLGFVLFFVLDLRQKNYVIWQERKSFIAALGLKYRSVVNDRRFCGHIFDRYFVPVACLLLLSLLWPNAGKFFARKIF